MLGHGSPYFAFRRLLPRRNESLGPRFAQIIGIAVCAFFSALATGAAEEIDLGLRITWGGGQTTVWQGKLLLSQGHFGEVHRLGLEADLPGAMQLQDGRIHFWEHTPTLFDGFDFRVRAESDTLLTIQLSTGTSLPTTITVPLAKFVEDNSYVHRERLDDSQNRLLVRRAPGDELGVEFEHRDSLVFWPREEPTVLITPRHLGLAAGTAVRCDVQLVDQEQTSLWHENFDYQVDTAGSFGPIPPLTVPLPNQAGVYSLLVSVSQRRFTQFMPQKPLRQRKVQLLVVGQRGAAEPIAVVATPWSEVAEIDLADPSWWQQLNLFPQLGRLPGLGRNLVGSSPPVGSSPLKAIEHRGERYLELGPNQWHAVPIPIAQTGIPHRLELDYPNDVPQTVGLTILEPNAANIVAPPFLDSGINVPIYPPAESYEVNRHQLLFWPRTKTPWLLITNRWRDSPAVFRGLRLTSGPAELPASPAVQVAGESRLLAVYYDKPHFPQNFTAAEALESSTNPARSLNDWQTFYDGGKRLVQYLKYVGYNAAIISAFRDGSTLYPSQLLQSTPRYDNGSFFVSGQDPVAKDVLEMLFRQFDEANLSLIPALHFSSPLPELERLLRTRSPDSQGIQLANSKGESYVDVYGTRRGLATYYNPLDDRVQAAILQVVNELVVRYSHHPSFKGVSLQIGPSTFAQLPDEEWGQDPRTWQRFQQATASDGASPIGAATIEFTEQTRKAWLDWRASELADLYQEMAASLTQRRADAKVYLAMADSLNAPLVQEEMTPHLLQQGDFADSMRRQGIDAAKFRSENVVLLRPCRLSPHVSLSKQGADFEINRSRAVDEFFSQASAHGVLNFHESLDLRLPEFDKVSPFGEGTTTTWVSAHIPPAGHHSRARFTNALANLDRLTLVDGGRMIPLGQEESVRELLATYRRLPARLFQTVQPTLPADLASSVTVRYLELPGQTFCYCVNNGPWTADVTIDVATGPGCRVQTLDRRTLPPLQEAENGLAWRVQLRPYDIQAAVFLTPRAKVVDWRARLQGSVEELVTRTFKDISTRLKTLQNPKPLPVLTNPSFEQLGDRGRIPGWNSTQARGARAAAEVDPTTGRNALHFQVTDPKVSGWVRSENFPLPATGRISVLAWIRTADANRQPPLRISVDLLSGGRSVKYFYHPLGANFEEPGQPAKELDPVKKLTQTWPQNPFLFHIDNLPVEGPTEVAIGFDLIGEGEVWIDDVQVYDLFFEEGEQEELERRSATAHHQLIIGNLAECQQYLDSYWPRFLLEFVPVAEPRLAAVPVRREEPTPPEPPPSQEQEDRRSWRRFLKLPNPFR
jgi:hypothetical protein